MVVPLPSNFDLETEVETFVDSEGDNLLAGISSLWSRRELVWIFLIRQISTRYRQMVFGIVWALLEPLALLVIMTLVFGRLLKVDTGGYPYPVFAFAGLIPWLLFTRASTAAASSLIDNMGLISKVAFPRLLLPLVAVLREVFDNGIMVIILVALAALYGYWPNIYIFAIPLVLAYAAMSAFVIGLWLACIMVPFRDVRPVLGLLLQAGMYATPILYPPSLVPSWILPFYQLNPMYWCVEFFRFILLKKDVLITHSFYFSVAIVGLAAISGLAIFNAGQKKVVDVQ